MKTFKLGIGFCAGSAGNCCHFMQANKFCCYNEVLVISHSHCMLGTGYLVSRHKWDTFELYVELCVQKTAAHGTVHSRCTHVNVGFSFPFCQR
jgi:hypothetical protein